MLHMIARRLMLVTVEAETTESLIEKLQTLDAVNANDLVRDSAEETAHYAAVNAVVDELMARGVL